VAAADPSAQVSEGRISHITGSWLHVFRPSLINEVRLTDFRRWNATLAAGMNTTIAKDVGLKGVAQDGMPRINVTGLTSLGHSAQYSDQDPTNMVNFLDSLSWFRGKHNLKMGGEWRASPIQTAYGPSRSGAISFNDVATGRGFALAALLLGWVRQANVEEGDVDARTDYYGFYLQDDWKVSPRLTLNLGLRWEMETPRREAKNRQSGFDPFQINPVSGTPGVITFAGINGQSEYANEWDRNNFGPRVGFAWRPFGNKTAFRGGYGLMYAPLYDGTSARALVAGFGDVRQFASPDNGVTPALLLKDGIPPAPAEERGPGFGAVRVGEAIRTSVEFIDRDIRSPYAHQMSFNIQHELSRGYLVDIGYSGKLGHKWSGRAVDINEIRPELRGATQDQRRRPFPQFGSVTAVMRNWGNSSYHGLNAKIEKRFFAGLNLLANYTWSKFLDDVEATGEAGGAPGTGQQSTYAHHLDKSLSGNDIRHRFTVSSVYQLPVGKGRRFQSRHAFADAIMGGWSLGTIAEFRTGLPYGVVESSNRLNAFSQAQRSNLVGDPALPTDRSRAELVAGWFNTAAFAFPGNGVLGNAARNIGIGPGFASVDASLLKDFNFAERRFVQLRAEFFNLFNRANFSNPNGGRGSAAFGQISSTVNDGRIVQFGLRVVF